MNKKIGLFVLIALLSISFVSARNWIESDNARTYNLTNLGFISATSGQIAGSPICTTATGCGGSGSVSTNVSTNVLAKANSTGGLVNSSISDDGTNVDTFARLRVFNNAFLYGNLTMYSAPSASGFAYFGVQTLTVNGSGAKIVITNQNAQDYTIGQYNTANTLSIGNATPTSTPAFNMVPNGSIGLFTVTPRTQFESNALTNSFANKVGIGNNAPNSTLDVIGNASFTVGSGNGLLVQSGTANTNAYIDLNEAQVGANHGGGLFVDGNLNYLSIRTKLSNVYTDKIVIPYAGSSSGNVGINNSLPNATLDVSGSGRFISLFVDNDAVLTTTGIDSSNITSGTINESRLPNSGVSSGTYGNASNVTVFAVDQYGRVTSATSQAISIDLSQVNSGYPAPCSVLGDYQSVGIFRNSSGVFNNCTSSAGGIIAISGITVAYNANGTVNLTVTASGSGNVTSTNGQSGYVPIFTSSTNIDRWVLATSLVNQTYADSTYGNGSFNFTCGAGTALQSGAYNKLGTQNTTSCVSVGGSVTVHNLTIINSTNGTSSHTISFTFTNGTTITTTFTDTDTNDTTAVGGLYVNLTAMKVNVTNLELQNVTNYNLFLNRTGLPANSTAAGAAYYSSGYVYNGTDIVNYALPLSNVFANMSGISCASNVNGSCNLTVTATGGSGTPGGSDTYVQYNDGGVFNGDSGFTFNDVTDDVTMLSDLRLTDASGDRGVVFLVSDGAGVIFINSSGRIRLQASGNNLTEVTGQGFYFTGNNPNLDVYSDSQNKTVRVINTGLGEAYLHVDDKISVNSTPNNGSAALTVGGTANISGAVCIANDCRTAWPSGTGGNTTLEMRNAINNTGPYNISIPLTNITGSDTNVCTSTDKVTSVNITNGNLVINCAADVGGAGSPGGADTYIQFNNAGSFGGNINFTYSPSTRDVHLAGGDFFLDGPGDRSLIFNSTTGASIYFTGATSNRLRMDAGGSSALLEILADGIYFTSGDPEMDLYSDSANQTFYIKNAGSQEAWLRVDNKVSIGAAPSSTSDNLVVTGNATVTQNLSTSLFSQNGYVSPYAFQSQYWKCQEGEFLGSNSGGTAPFSTLTISSGAIAQQAATDNDHVGVLILRDSSTTNGGSAVGIDFTSTGTITPKAGDEIRGIWQQRSGKVAEVAGRTGFFDTLSLSEPVDGCHILWNSSGNVATARCRAGSVTTSNATTYTYSNATWYGWSVKHLTNNSANFTIWNDTGGVLLDVGLSIGVNSGAANAGAIGTHNNNTADSAADMYWVDYMSFCRQYKPQRAWSYGQ